MTLGVKFAVDADLKSTSRRFWWIAAFLGIATGIFFRVHHLGSESLWFDEGYTAWMVSHPPGEIIRLIRADTAPPLYYLLLRGWTDLFGRSEVALRSLSAVFSIITVFVALDIARKLLRNPAAIAAVAWVMGVSFMQIWYAQEARAYALMALLGVAAFDFLLYHLAERGRRWLPPLAITIAAAMYTHNMMAPYVAGLVIAWLVLPSEHTSRRRIKEIGVVLAIAIVLYSPWLIFGLPAQLRMIQRGFWVEPLNSGNFLTAIVGLAGVQQYWSWGSIVDRVHIPIGSGLRAAIVAIILLIASAILSIGKGRRSERRAAIGLLAMALFPPVAIAVYSLVWTPLFMPKIFLPSAALLPIFALLPLATRWPRKTTRGLWIGVGLLLALSALTLYGHEVEDRKEDWRQLARIVSELPGGHRLIIFDANDGQLPFDYYYRYHPGDDPTGVPGGFFDLDPPQTMRRVKGDRDLEPLKARLDSGSFDEIVLVNAHDHWGDPDHLTENLLASRFILSGSTQVNDLSMRWYLPRSVKESPPTGN